MLGVDTLALASPANRRDLPNSVTCAERGKPLWVFQKETRRPVRVVMPMEVKDRGKSECWLVMSQIGDEKIALTRKGADFRVVVCRSTVL